MIPFAVTIQWNSDWPDSLHVLGWLFLPFHSKKTAPGIFELLAQIILKSQTRCAELLARDTEKIVIPVQS